MDCRRAKTGLALWVGEDLPDAAEVAALRRHVSRCASCACYLTQLRASQEALRAAQSGPPAFVTSLWPQVKSEIVRHEKQKRHERFNGWIPAVAMAAAVLMIVGVSVGPQLGQPRDPWQHGDQFSTVSRGFLGGSRDLFRDPGFLAGERQSPQGPIQPAGTSVAPRPALKLVPHSDF